MRPDTPPVLRPLERFSDRVTLLPTPARYTIAILAAAAAVLLRLALDGVWGDRLPYLTLFPAVMLSAWLGGLGPGMLTTLLSAAAAAYLWIPTTRSWAVADPSEWLGLFIFVAVSAVISALNESWRRSARALAESEQLLAVTLASIGDAILTTDVDGRIAQMNAVAQALTGWTLAQARGRPYEDVFVVVDEHGQRLPDAVRKALREGVVTALESDAVLVSRTGQATPIDDSAAAIRTADGRTAGAVVVFRDITERRRLQLEALSQSRALRELAAIVESSDDAIVSKDLDSTVRSWNGGAERIFGYSASEMIGQSIRKIIPEERWSEEDEVLRQLRRGEKVDHYETVRRRKDGELVAVSLTISPIHSGGGEVIGASKIARDIRQRLRAEADLAESLRREQAARAEVERASGLKDEFLAVLSHELRTPLNAVVGYSQLLDSGALSAEQARHAVQAILRNARAQAHMIESLLDMSRVLAGKLELTLEHVNLSDAVNGAVDSLRPQGAAKAIRCVVHHTAARVGVPADPARLQQILVNVLSNAIKFTPQGGSVTVTTSADSTHAIVTVVDTGRGIRPDLLPRIFDRFTQGVGEESGARGLGLGLSLVRDLVRAHGGTVSASSPGAGYGSTFTVVLPLAQTGTAWARTPDRAPLDTPVAVNALRVLVVDDEKDAREMATLMLGTRGAQVTTAASAAEAMEILRQAQPDVLLADISMPDEDGYSLIRSWRAEEHVKGHRRVPAIAVTAYASPRDRDLATAAGFDRHIAKPIDIEEVMRAITSATTRP